MFAKQVSNVLQVQEELFLTCFRSKGVSKMYTDSTTISKGRTTHAALVRLTNQSEHVNELISSQTTSHAALKGKCFERHLAKRNLISFENFNLRIQVES